jgi:hypothetical protein
MNSNRSGKTPNLEKPLQELLASFRLSMTGKREVWNAYKESPDGLERCALRAKAKAQREGISAGGLLVAMIRSGEHLLVAEPDTPLVTGWRFVFGEGHAAGTFVRDPNGTDRLPPNYDFLTHNPDASRPSVRYDDDTPRVDHG